MQVRGNNRSVMPLDVLGCTRATLVHAASKHACGHSFVECIACQPAPRGVGNLVKVHRAGDRLLQVSILNEEFPVDASHQLASITSLPFVHTARRSYRLNGAVNCTDALLHAITHGGGRNGTEVD
jgi:hypothetical protein